MAGTANSGEEAGTGGGGRVRCCCCCPSKRQGVGVRRQGAAGRGLEGSAAGQDGAGRWCRAVSSSAHGHHAACVPWCGRSVGAGERTAGAEAGRAGLCCWVEREAAAH